ncbi:MAG: hypothetical protein QM299_07575 [Pseudomonadota bacterium]|nr:hypothetical protein [Pseudomonadota bacterium]HPD21894.1 hypothetical protein [Deltaproteobacteria bacterium]HPX18473.1 hypothetical protein [Deltaproteobacteria bacterium]
MKILILGVRGFIGSYLRKLILKYTDRGICKDRPLVLQARRGCLS